MQALNAHKDQAGDIKGVGCDTRVLETEEQERPHLLLKGSLYLTFSQLSNDNAGLVLLDIPLKFSGRVRNPDLFVT